MVVNISSVRFKVTATKSDGAQAQCNAIQI